QGQPGPGRGREPACPPGRGHAHHRTDNPGTRRKPAQLTHVMAATRAGGHHGGVTRSPAMEYEVSLLGREPLPLAAITESLLTADPAALVDVDGGRALLRLSTFLCAAPTCASCRRCAAPAAEAEPRDTPFRPPPSHAPGLESPGHP